MTPSPAIDECREIRRRAPGLPWAWRLIAYLDEPPDDRLVFDWLCSCVGDLLDHLGRASVEFTEALDFARIQAAKGVEFEAVERRAWGFWLRRSEGEAFTAVAQLLFALSHGNRSQRRHLAMCCSTPISLLERLESRSGEVFDRVVDHFSKQVGDGPV